MRDLNLELFSTYILEIFLKVVHNSNPSILFSEVFFRFHKRIDILIHNFKNLKEVRVDERLLTFYENYESGALAIFFFK